ncbi:hypothetical protein R6Q59_017697 [Mikania micrantha]
MKGGFVCCLLLLFLGFMFCATDASSIIAPKVELGLSYYGLWCRSTGNSGWIKNEGAFPQIHFQGKIGTISDREKVRYEASTARRLDLEHTDYDGTGANDRHDPKSPGRA